MAAIKQMIEPLGVPIATVALREREREREMVVEVGGAVK